MQCLAITLAALVFNLNIAYSNSVFLTDMNSTVQFSVVYIVCMLVVRPIFNWGKYYFYMYYASVQEVEYTPSGGFHRIIDERGYSTAAQREKDVSPDLIKEGDRSLKYKINRRDDNTQLEGGEDDIGEEVEYFEDGDSETNTMKKPEEAELGRASNIIVNNDVSP